MEDFKPTETIVYNGVISTFGVLQPFLEEGDEVRLATKEEIDLYNKRPER
jgi:predicted ABC-type exoprotein transport system permease subunit